MERGLPLALALAVLGAATSALGEDVAPLVLETLAGEPTSVALEPDESALVVHFWATWCPECVEELPVLARAIPRCAAQGVRVVTVSVGESREVVADFLAAHGLALEPLRDPRGRAWRGLGGVGLPTNLSWTREGRRVDVGPRDAGAWRAALAALGCAPDRASPPARGRDPR